MQNALFQSDVLLLFILVIGKSIFYIELKVVLSVSLSGWFINFFVILTCPFECLLNHGPALRNYSHLLLKETVFTLLY